MIGAFVKAPPFAWSGWRLRIPGGPEGGQYHGFVAEDGHDILGVEQPAPGQPGPYPHPSPWDSVWGGVALKEGQTRSDYVYRSSAEIPPRANASGGDNVVYGFQTKKTAGYAEAPGNYRGVGAIGVPNVVACPEIACANPTGFGPAPCHTPICGGAVVRQPPPPRTPAPSPTVCASGQIRDAAGYCTSDEHNPYVLYLPNSPAPAPTVSAMPTAGVTSSTTASAATPYPDGYGNYFSTQSDAAASAAALAASGGGISAWLSQSTVIAGVPNMWIAGGAALVAFFLMRKK